mgnify:CR=1 FL=1
MSAWRQIPPRVSQVGPRAISQKPRWRSPEEERRLKESIVDKKTQGPCEKRICP